jgi:hypothetical protein
MYFSNAVMKAKEDRESVQSKQLPKTDDYTRAKQIAWIRDKCPNIYNPQDFAWLERYEARHGKLT